MDDSPDIVQLRYLNKQYEEITLKLNDQIIELGQVKAKVQIVDSEVKKLSNMQNLALEAIRCEKKIFDVNKR